MKFRKIEFIVLPFCFLLAIGFTAYSIRNIILDKDKETRILVNETALSVSSFVSKYNYQLLMLQSRAEELMSDNFDTQYITSRLVEVEGKGWELQPEKSDTLTSFGRVTGTGSIKNLSNDKIQEIYMAETLNKSFISTSRILPNSPFTYYISKANFFNLTPRYTEDFAFFSDEYITFDLFTSGLPKNNPSKSIFWSKPYIDTGGKGLMTTAGIPLYHKGEFKGNISIDMLFVNIADYLKSNTFKDQHISLVDDYNQLVSSTLENIVTSDSIPTLSHLIGDSSQIEIFDKQTFLWHKNKRIFVSDIPNSKWKIFHFETAKEFYGSIIFDIAYIIFANLFLLVIIYLLFNTNRLRIRNKDAKIKAENANQKIKESINYASRIQQALIPSTQALKNNFAEHFVFWRPRDVVSGDYYWVRDIGDEVVVVVADCTGHGIPGAFMSMLGISFLNQMVSSGKVLPGQILDEMRKNVKRSLRQNLGSNSNKDGIDMAFFTICKSDNQLRFAGAHNPLYIVRKYEPNCNDVVELKENKRVRLIESEDKKSSFYLIELKPNAQPVGIYPKEQPFHTHHIQLKKGDCLYAFSDGFYDQTGGANKRKFMSKKFKQLLLQLADKPMNIQKKELGTTIDNWQQDYQQVDDMLILGIRV
ncbi:SpoIIE family protein phosphatase [Bernardetia sp.]|uniref:SpoIIE family protein phosphatase n=1 Tax=Bernardetia sp. TaxID=1937974 RepID=UPI0025BC5309|nr:SpoIIE family protein phosphatase [Bernardetia sp.]